MTTDERSEGMKAMLRRRLSWQASFRLAILLIVAMSTAPNATYGDTKIKDSQTGQEYGSFDEALEATFMGAAEKLLNSTMLYIRGDRAIFISEWKDMRDGEISDKRYRVPLNGLKEHLRKLAKGNPDRIKSVVLIADTNVSYKDLVQVVRAYEDALSKIESFNPGDVRYIFMGPYDATD